MFTVETEDNEVTVGILDSIYDPGDEFRNYNTVGRTFDVIDSGVDGTCGHGYKIIDILAGFTDNPEYQFFQVVNESGKSRDSYLMKAIGLAMEYGEVDVLNLSVGADHVSDEDRDCTEAISQCALCEVAEEAIDQGITIVASSGNHPHVESVCCPSLSSLVISVGGAVTKCTASIDGYNYQTSNGGFPPNAIWVQREDERSSEVPLCSNRGCIPGESCSENQNTEPWRHNVEFTDRKPDILAPSHWVWKSEERGPVIDQGTSFSTPLVTAGIVVTLDWARRDGWDISSQQIREAIRSSGHNFSDIDRRYFSQEKFTNELRRLLGLEPEPIIDAVGGPVDMLGNNSEF